MTTTQPHLFVANRAQAAIYEMEMKGQLSGGRWKNSKPMYHWEVPCRAAVIVRPETTGRDFPHPRGYNFGEKDLFSVVGERVIRYCQAAIAFPNVPLSVLKKYSSIIERDAIKQFKWIPGGANNTIRATMMELFAECGITHNMPAVEFEGLMAATKYTQAMCQKDASALTMCFRKQIEPESILAKVVNPLESGLDLLDRIAEDKKYEGMSTYEMCVAGKYKSKVPYEYVMVPVDPDTMTITQGRIHEESEKLKKKAQHALQARDCVRLERVFREDLENEFGMRGHAKADLLFEKAYDRGHAHGMSEVALIYQDLVELVELVK